MTTTICQLQERESATPAGPELAEDRLARLVTELNTICKAATLEFALRVGELVVKNVYEGDVSRFRTRARKGETALRQLAKHPDLAISSASLYRSVAIYELCARIGRTDGSSWRHLSTTHFRLVLPLSYEEQERLLRLAEDERWSVKRLELEIGSRPDAERASLARGGRQPSTRLARTMRALDRDMHALTVLLELSDESASASAENARATIETLDRLAKTCTRLGARLAHTLPRPDREARRPVPDDDDVDSEDFGWREAPLPLALAGMRR